jgi:hypothetical protein
MRLTRRWAKNGRGCVATDQRGFLNRLREGIRVEKRGERKEKKSGKIGGGGEKAKRDQERWSTRERDRGLRKSSIKSREAGRWRGKASP